MRYELLRSNHTIGPLDRSPASARHMEFGAQFNNVNVGAILSARRYILAISPQSNATSQLLATRAIDNRPYNAVFRLLEKFKFD